MQRERKPRPSGLLVEEEGNPSGCFFPIQVRGTRGVSKTLLRLKFRIPSLLSSEEMRPLIEYYSQLQLRSRVA